MRRPCAARCFPACFFCVVNFPVFRCKADIRNRPSTLVGPQDAPPCIRHRALSCMAGALHGAPERVLAPQRRPGQFGPNLCSTPWRRLSIGLCFITSTSSPCMGCWQNEDFHRMRGVNYLAKHTESAAIFPHSFSRKSAILINIAMC